MRPQSCVVFALGVLASACSFVGATAEIGFIQLSLAGDVALASGLGGVPAAAEQGVASALGLGSERGSPYLRGQLDLGNTVVTGSAILLSEDGAGSLASAFGQLSPSTLVESEFEYTQAKFSITRDFDLGPVKLSPGLGLDLVDVKVKAREASFGNSDEIDELMPLPMLYLRAEADVGIVGAIAEIGWLDLPEVGGFEAEVLDLEAMIEYCILPSTQLFVGYRYIAIDGHGEDSDSSYAVDMKLDGWMIGGGLRF